MTISVVVRRLLFGVMAKDPIIIKPEVHEKADPDSFGQVELLISRFVLCIEPSFDRVVYTHRTDAMCPVPHTLTRLMTNKKFGLNCGSHIQYHQVSSGWPRDVLGTFPTTNKVVHFWTLLHSD